MESINQETGEFIEEKKLAEIELAPSIELTMPKIEFNYEELKEIMSVGLKEYAIEVTSDNLKDAKAMATKLNKLAGEIKKARIANKKEVLIPVSEFETKMNDLEDTAQKGRQFILDQVKVFDDAQIKICTTDLNKYIEEVYQENFIEEEFKNVDITDLYIASNLTASNNLSKKAKDTVKSRVNLQLAKQTNKKMRLVQLENESLKAGLKALLTEQDVSSFILESDLVYSEKLAELINRELNKQKQIEINIAMEKEKTERKEALELEIEEKRKKDVEQKQKEEVQKLEDKTGNKIVSLVATFEIEVPVSVNESDVLEKYESKLKEMFSTLSSVALKEEK